MVLLRLKLNSNKLFESVFFCLDKKKNKDDVALVLLAYYKTDEDINKQDLNGDHALLYAAFNKNSKMVGILLKAGANADLPNKYGTTALWYSVYNNDCQTLFELLPYLKRFDDKISPELVYETQATPVELCEQTNRFKILYMLLLGGAKISKKSVDNIDSKYMQAKIDIQIGQHNKQAETNFYELKLIHDFIHVPLSLKRQCRCFIKLNNLLFDCLDNTQLPVDLKNFLSYISL